MIFNMAFTVSDLAAAKRFYTEKLGFVVEYEQNGETGAYLSLKKDGFVLAFVPPSENMPEMYQKAFAGKGAWLDIVTDDAKDLHHKLQANGVEGLGPVQEKPWGLSFGFVDPNGIGLHAYQPVMDTTA